MDTLGLIILVIGFIVSAVAGIWILVLAFKESALWGIGSLLCNIVSLIFIIMHWADAKRPFFIQLGGVGLMFLGSMMGGSIGFGDDEGNDDASLAALQEERQRFPENFEDEKDDADTMATKDGPTAATRPASVLTNRLATNRLAVPSGPTNRFATNRLASAARVPNRTATNTALRAQAPPRSVPSTALSNATPGTAQTEEPPISAPVPAKLEPIPPPLLLPGHRNPLEVQVTSIGPNDGSDLRNLTLRMTNRTRKVPKQIRLTLVYLDSKGTSLKEWSTSIFDPQPSLKSNVPVDIVQPAFFMPPATASVAARVESIRFDDGTDWGR